MHVDHTGGRPIVTSRLSSSMTELVRAMAVLDGVAGVQPSTRVHVQPTCFVANSMPGTPVAGLDKMVAPAMSTSVARAASSSPSSPRMLPTAHGVVDKQWLGASGVNDLGSSLPLQGASLLLSPRA